MAINYSSFFQVQQIVLISRIIDQEVYICVKIKIQCGLLEVTNFLIRMEKILKE
jgi:hypothetical protein